MTQQHTFDTLLLDYGHGGVSPSGEYLTPGEKQYTFTSHDDLFIGEGITNRETAWRLARLALAEGYEVYDVVAGHYLQGDPGFNDLEQQNVSLNTRVLNANQHDPDRSLLVSIHGNAIGDHIAGHGEPANGASFWTSKGQTLSDKVADTLHQAFTLAFSDEPVRTLRGDAASDGDTDYEADFYVLRKSRMPAVLGEVLFFTNITDARYLLSARGQDVIANAYWSGIRPWMRLPGHSC